MGALASLSSVPSLRGWQAKRIAYGYAAHQHRPKYKVVRLRRISKYRLAVRGHEPGYLGPSAGPDITVTLVERRGYQFWVRDPFVYEWSRWL